MCIVLTIPAIPRSHGPWNFRCTGLAAKFTKMLIEEIVKVTLVYEKIKKSEIVLEIHIKTKDDMAKCNQRYRKKEGATDTISIPIDNQSLHEAGPTLLGTIFLCLEEINENASEIGINETKHLAHIVVHSTLHLLGYDHEEENDRKRMQAKEERILARLGIASPYLDN